MGNHASTPADAAGTSNATTVAPAASAGQQDKAHIQKMDDMIRRKFRAGAQYNMKVVIRGERRAGKSALWSRLQGMPYVHQYQPTAEIQSTTINWSFKDSEDAVKVEVWDVVDKGISSQELKLLPEGGTLEDRLAGLPTSGSGWLSGGSGSMSKAIGVLDATMVDVYKGAQAAIFVVNPFVRSSFDYAVRGVEEVPEDVCIAVLLSYRDLVEQAVSLPDGPQPAVSPEEVHALVQRRRAKDLAQGLARHVACFEASMRDCFGLRILYNYLNVPFMELKRQSLVRQVQAAALALQGAVSELENELSSHDYSHYLGHLRATRADPTVGRAAPPSKPQRPQVPVVAPEPPPPPQILMRHRSNSGDNPLAAPQGAEGKKSKKRGHRDKDKGADGGSSRKASTREAAGVEDGSKRHHRHRHSSKKDREKATGGADRGEQRSMDAPKAPTEPLRVQDMKPPRDGAEKEELDDFLGSDSGGEGAGAIPRDYKQEEDRMRVAACLKETASTDSMVSKEASSGAAGSSKQIRPASQQAAGSSSDEEPLPQYGRLKRVQVSSRPALVPLPLPAAATGQPTSSASNGTQPTTAVAQQPPKSPPQIPSPPHQPGNASSHSNQGMAHSDSQLDTAGATQDNNTAQPIRQLPAGPPPNQDCEGAGVGPPAPPPPRSFSFRARNKCCGGEGFT